MPMTKEERALLQKAAEQAAEAGDRVKELLERIQLALDDKPVANNWPLNHASNGNGAYTNGTFTNGKYHKQ